MWGILLTCFSMSSKRVEAYCKEIPTMTIAITIPTIVRTQFLTSIHSTTIRPSSVICPFGSQTSSSARGAIHFRESLTKTSPTTRHWGTITWGDHIPLPLPNSKGSDSLLVISGLGISGTTKGISVPQLVVPKQPKLNGIYDQADRVVWHVGETDHHSNLSCMTMPEMENEPDWAASFLVLGCYYLHFQVLA